jgi:hypothetical protein
MISRPRMPVSRWWWWAALPPGLECRQRLGRDDPAGAAAERGRGVDGGQFTLAYPGADLILTDAGAVGHVAHGQAAEAVEG